MGKIIDRVRARQAAAAIGGMDRLAAEHRAEMLRIVQDLHRMDENWRRRLEHAAAAAEPAQTATGATQDPRQGWGVGGVACGAPASLQGPAR